MFLAPSPGSPAGPSMVVIETEALRKEFRTRRRVIEAVRGVDLRVEAGEVYGFLGPNGAGKTTTLRMLATLLAPSGGTARVVGYDLIREPEWVRERIGYVGQGGGTDPRATGRENLLLQARLYGMDRPRAEARTSELVETLELGPLMDRLADSLSSGQRRRLDLALGMVNRPSLLFLDEPTTGLDPQSRARVWDEIRALRDRGTTVFLTTHYLEEADELCHRLAIIDEGRIVAEGTPVVLKREIAGDLLILGLEADAAADPAAEPRAETLLRPLPFVRELHRADGFIRLYVEHGEAALPEILRVLDSAGLPLRTLSLSRPSLDDVFLKKTGRSLREEKT
jgi:ABC-2 type transport system ATP-binding protein